MTEAEAGQAICDVPIQLGETVVNLRPGGETPSGYPVDASDEAQRIGFVFVPFLGDYPPFDRETWLESDLMVWRNPDGPDYHLGIVDECDTVEEVRSKTSQLLNRIEYHRAQEGFPLPYVMGDIEPGMCPPEESEGE